MIVLLACGALIPETCFSVRKGVLWLLFATMADVPPAVSAECFLVQFLVVQYRVTSQVLTIMNLNGDAVSFQRKMAS
jgi:hypothetical protein